MSKCILSIDQGTTNTKALLVDGDGLVMARASRPVSICYPQPAWVEQDPQAIWRSVEEAMDECLEQLAGNRLSAVAITNQRETVMIWDRATGEPLGPCAVWQCTRGSQFCDELRAKNLEPTIRERTGLTIDPMFSAAKAGWLLDHTEGGRARARRGEICVGTMDSWVLWNLTRGGVHATDLTNASRTQLLDLRTCAWDPGLCDIFDVALEALPELQESGSLFGETAARGRLPAGVPIASVIGDSHAALFGHNAFDPGAVKATYGTGSSLMTATGEIVTSAYGLSATIAFSTENEVMYALEGNIYATGAAVQWFGNFLELENPAAGVADLAESAADNGGVYLVPAFVGLGAPHWNDRARGLLTGITRGTNQAHVARATIESIALQIHDVFHAMENDSAAVLPALLADGGASQNDTLMQLQADILDRPVLRSSSADLSALGAAYLAGLVTNVWQSREQIAALPRIRDRFEPKLPESARSALLAGWREAVARTLANT
jgi:glycerol kinase